MKDIKSIDIIFENCDYIKINRNDIGDLYLGGISKSIHLFSNAVVEIWAADKVYLNIKNNKGKTEFGTSLERQLKNKDITSLKIYYTDETEEIIYCKWKRRRSKK